MFLVLSEKFARRLSMDRESLDFILTEIYDFLDYLENQSKMKKKIIRDYVQKKRIDKDGY